PSLVHLRHAHRALSRHGLGRGAAAGRAVRGRRRAQGPVPRQQPARDRLSRHSGRAVRAAGGAAAQALLAHCHEAAFGTPLESRILTAGTDARFFGLYAGIPAFVYGPIANDIHAYDERVDLESLRRVTQTIALFIADWCGVATAGRGAICRTAGEHGFVGRLLERGSEVAAIPAFFRPGGGLGLEGRACLRPDS